MSNRNPKVSILIPVYNREHLIEETVNSALAQTYRDFEIVIVDNCSTDNTYEILQAMTNTNPQIRLFQNSENLGPVKNWQKCLEYSKGEYIKILWSDDLIHETFLEKSVPVLENNMDVGFVYTKVKIFSDDWSKEMYRLGETGKYPVKFFYDGQFLEKHSIPVSPGCALFRKKDVIIHDSIPNKLGLDHSKNGAGIDLLVFLDASKKYPYFWFIDVTLSYFRAHQGSFSIANNLSAEYLTAKHYFLQRDNLVEYVSRFNAILYLWISKNKKNITLPSIQLRKYLLTPNPSSNNRISWVFLVLAIQRRVLRKFKKYVNN
jgi:glycosyltransferase involved in cell wall biosynthesis